MSRQDDIKKLIRAHNRRMQVLKEQKAIQGVSVDPKIVIEMEDIEAEVEKLEADLKEIDEGIAASPQINSTISRDAHGKSQRVPLFPGRNGLYINPHLRPWALAGMIIVPLIAILILFIPPVQDLIATAIYGPSNISKRDSRFPDHLQEIWNSLGEDGNLGNFESVYNRSNYSRQLFEGGIMLWWDNPNGESKIWVIETEGHTNQGYNWTSYKNTWSSDEDVFPSGCPETQGEYGPMMGFGKIWCDNFAVKNKLGKATDNEFASNDAIVRNFSRGITIYIPEFKEIWVLYYDDNWVKFD